jgi:hypothetical protein
MGPTIQIIVSLSASFIIYSSENGDLVGIVAFKVPYIVLQFFLSFLDIY